MCNCDHEAQQTWPNEPWRPGDSTNPTPENPCPELLYKREVLETIEETINELSDELRTLSLDIHRQL
jgi:hypothetical protein